MRKLGTEDFLNRAKDYLILWHNKDYNSNRVRREQVVTSLYTMIGNNHRAILKLPEIDTVFYEATYDCDAEEMTITTLRPTKQTTILISNNKLEDCIYSKNKEKRKISLIKEIAGEYGYNIDITNGKVVFDDGTMLGTNSVGQKEYVENKKNTHYEYDSVDEALKEWVVIMENTNFELMLEGADTIWSREDIDLILSIN